MAARRARRARFSVATASSTASWAASWSPRREASQPAASSRDPNGSGRTTVALEVGTGSGLAASTRRARRPLSRRRSGAPSAPSTSTASTGPSGLERTM